MNNNLQIATVAITVHDQKCLLLHRNNPPVNWCPPCGRLEKNESVILGLKREVLEETGLMIEPILPVDVWKGLHNDQPILSVTYVCFVTSNRVTLSKEHSEYVWLSIDELTTNNLSTDFDLKSWPLYIKLAHSFLKMKDNG